MGMGVLLDGQNVTDGIDLSVSYDLDNVKQVDVWILLPPLESAGEFHEITLKVSPKVDLMCTLMIIHKCLNL